MHTHDITDVTIIGGGPTGLFALFYAGMRGASAQIVDALPQLGGQLTALYPEKYIFDVAGFPKVLAKDLVKQLAEQAAQFGAPAHLNERVVGLDESDGHFVLVTETARYPTRAIVIAAGIGAFSPRRLPQKCAEPWYGRGIYDVVTNPDDYRGQHVVIIGGGDSAFDWAAQLRRARGVGDAGAPERPVPRARGDDHGGAGECGERPQHAGADVPRAARRACDDETLCGVTLRDTKTKETRDVRADVVLPMLGFVSDIGPLAEWGLTLEKDEIVVNSMMETGRPGVYAAGDVTTYPGKLKLIASGLQRGGDRGEPGGALDLPGEEGDAGAQLEPGDLRAEGRLRRAARCAGFRDRPGGLSGGSNCSAPSCLRGLRRKRQTHCPPSVFAPPVADRGRDLLEHLTGPDHLRTAQERPEPERLGGDRPGDGRRPSRAAPCRQPGRCLRIDADGCPV